MKIYVLYLITYVSMCETRQHQPVLLLSSIFTTSTFHNSCGRTCLCYNLEKKIYAKMLKTLWTDKNCSNTLLVTRLKTTGHV